MSGSTTITNHGGTITLILITLLIACLALVAGMFSTSYANSNSTILNGQKATLMCRLCPTQNTANSSGLPALYPVRGAAVPYGRYDFYVTP
jgi:hypothetical protein